MDMHATVIDFSTSNIKLSLPGIAIVIDVKLKQVS